MSAPVQIAPRTLKLDSNVLREILKVASRPEVISLAGGVPSPNSFPLDLVATLTRQVLDNQGDLALQYDRTEGFGPLREVLAPYLGTLGIEARSRQILITSGSQGALDSLGRVLIEPGDAVAVESPTYVGGLQAFNPYGPCYVSLPTDNWGVLPDGLEKILTRRPIKFIYLVPTFQNPTGRTLPMERRVAIAELLKRHRVLLVEDDPYHCLRYKGEPVGSIKQLAPEQVVYVGTFSKILAPGLRVGYCLAPEPIRKWMVIVKQGIDLHSSTFSQAIAAQYMEGGHLQRHLPFLCDLYAPKLAALLGALEDHLDHRFRWSHPEGGMFVWLTGPPGFDSQAAYFRAVEKGTAFVPGAHFFAEPQMGGHTLRLNFTMPSVAQIKQAVGVLGSILSGAPLPSA